MEFWIWPPEWNSVAREPGKPIPANIRIEIAEDPHFERVVSDSRVGKWSGELDTDRLRDGPKFMRVKWEEAHVSTDWSRVVFFTVLGKGETPKTEPK